MSPVPEGATSGPTAPDPDALDPAAPDLAAPNAAAPDALTSLPMPSDTAAPDLRDADTPPIFSNEQTVTDDFLNGKVRLIQPRHGYRAATDPVLLAAATPVRAGQSVLDIGCGAGAAALCLLARVPTLVVDGVEVQPAYADLARRNAALNGAAFAVHDGAVPMLTPDLRQRSFDAVMMNPPWFGPADIASPDAGRDTANRLDLPLREWVGPGLSRLREGGYLTIIQRTERLPEILAALGTRAGDVTVLPLTARIGRAARRVIVRARKSSRGPFRLCAPLVMHMGQAHDQDRESFTADASAILRDGAALPF